MFLKELFKLLWGLVVMLFVIIELEYFVWYKLLIFLMGFVLDEFFFVSNELVKIIVII